MALMRCYILQRREFLKKYLKTGVLGTTGTQKEQSSIFFRCSIKRISLPTKMSNPTDITLTEVNSSLYVRFFMLLMHSNGYTLLKYRHTDRTPTPGFILCDHIERSHVVESSANFLTQDTNYYLLDW